MIAVIDSSAAVAIALRRSDSRIVEDALANADYVIAPELFAAEVTNVFWKYHHLQKMPLRDCQNGLSDALALPDELVSQVALCREVFSMACHNGTPAYDMFFLVLARRHDAVLLTLDAKLERMAHKMGVQYLSKS